ncbi:asparagine synthase (glutamine-hydrolyzing) [Sulfitobacter pontiacus]|uniref:asparagine synthase (glutamine-hydrolyzing) n=1 Tax=Sulfitobacter pontiacus TaxID=60137 RepID=UPI00295EDAAE|nr:asparagine synthase (glutamine-hydrolyzing) [Sulfitobacter pontiacus]
MCGIAGIVEPIGRSGLKERWETTAERMSHRGPDAKHHLIREVGQKQILLGHLRLAIVDLTPGSDQPMVRDQTDMVFNGEIYDFRRWRAVLESQGQLFQTVGDSEVLLNAFRSKGNDCFQDFDGMWGVAILDRCRKRLTLSRDFFGEKPIYYLHEEGRFAFASDAMALCRLDGTARALNPAFLRHFILSGYAPPDCCVFQGIKRLEARQVLTLDLETMELSVEDQGPLFRAPVFGAESPFSIDRFHELFVKSLETRILADVPVGLMLSGGIDSSYVAAAARQDLDKRLHCLTVRYGQGSDVETDRARYVTETLGLPHQVVEVAEADLESLVEDAIPSMDEPISDVAYPLLLRVVGATPEETRVLLTGDGADELFLSYPGYRKYLSHLEGGTSRVGKLGPLIAGTVSRWPELCRRAWRRAAPLLLPMSASDSLFIDIALETGDWKRARLGDPGYNAGEQAALLYEHAYNNSLAEYLLVKSDRASMWHSKEFRTPFLNRALLEYVGCSDLNSLPRGSKTPLVARLNQMLGKDLAFSKRGMFARGERAFNHLLLPNLTTFDLPPPRSPQERYRHLVLGKWIEHHCSGQLG